MNAEQIRREADELVQAVLRESHRPTQPTTLAGRALERERQACELQYLNDRRKQPR